MSRSKRLWECLEGRRLTRDRAGLASCPPFLGGGYTRGTDLDGEADRLARILTETTSNAARRSRELRHSGALSLGVSIPAARRTPWPASEAQRQSKKTHRPRRARDREVPSPPGAGATATSCGRSYDDRRSATFCSTARRTVPSETPRHRAVARQPVPWARRWRSRTTSVMACGRRRCFP